MTSVIGAMLLTASCGYMGFAFGAQRKNELLVAEGFLALFRHLLLGLPSLRPMDELLREFKSPTLERAGIIKLLNTEEACGACNKRLAAAVAATENDSQLFGVLSRGIKGLGDTDYAAQEELLRVTVGELQMLCDTRKEAYKNGESCYRWVGVLCGAAVSILLF